MHQPASALSQQPAIWRFWIWTAAAGLPGEHYGLRSAMLVVLALVLVAAIVAKAVAKPDLKKYHGDGEQLMSIKLIAVDMDGHILSDQKPITVSALWRNTAR